MHTLSLVRTPPAPALSRPCPGHPDSYPVPAGGGDDIFACIHCGAYLVAVYCPVEQRLYADVAYLDDGPHVRAPAPSLEYGILCHACYADRAAAEGRADA